MDASPAEAERPVLIISHDVVGGSMAGPGIRYHHLARVLARHLPVTLAAPAGAEPVGDAGYRCLAYTSGEDAALEEAIAGARCVMAPAVWLARCPSLLTGATPLVVDGYDPFHAEVLFLSKEDSSPYLALLGHACLAGDLFVCASERQRDWWLGTLEAFGRVNIRTYADDASLRRLVDLVPYGLPEQPPAPSKRVVKGVWPGIGPQDRVVLWGGGLWPWLDPVTAVEAVAAVSQRRPDVRLVFPGSRHPNPDMAGIPTLAGAARSRAESLGLLDRVVFFGEWMPYADWPAALLESDLALSLHGPDTLESRLAFRSRVMDYIWAGLPVVASSGDVTSELVAGRGLGLVAPPGDAGAVTEAILRLLDEPKAAREPQFALARAELSWEQAVATLLRYCRAPWRAADKNSMGEAAGSPFYVQEMARRDRERLGDLVRARVQHDQETARLRAGQDTLRRRLTECENRRGLHLAEGLRTWRNALRGPARRGDSRTSERRTGIKGDSLLNKISSSTQRGPASEPGATPTADSANIASYDVTDHISKIDLSALEVIRWTPAWMVRSERLLLYSLIFGLRPGRYLEIGTFHGGSALIAAAAMDAQGHDGRMFCIDPEPKIAPEHWELIKHRATVIKGRSPEVLARAYEAAGGAFDFVLIDGDHSRAGVLRDAEGVLPFVAEGGYLLFHDGFNPDVAQGIDQFLRPHAGVLGDMGLLTREVTYEQRPDSGAVRWGGLRMMVVRPGGRVSLQKE